MINYSQSIKISQLNQLTGSNITVDDFIPIVDSGSLTTLRVSLGNLMSQIFSTGSMYGTSSWANNAISSSYALTASYAANSVSNYPDITDNTTTHKVGINNSNPQAALDVSGSILLNGYLINASNVPANSNFVGTSAGNNATNAQYSNFFGYGAGYNTNNGTRCNFFGLNSGYNATNVTDSNFFGYGAGYNTNGSSNSNFLGQNAGNSAYNCGNSIFIGQSAGQSANNFYSSTFIGYGAGQNASYSNSAGRLAQTTFIGSGAGANSVDVNYAICAGLSAGSGTKLASDLVAIGVISGINISASGGVIALGRNAGSNISSSLSITCIGQNAGQNSNNQQWVNCQGYNAGAYSNNSSFSNFFGFGAGYSASNANNSLFVGYYAGYQDKINNTGGRSSILIGDYTSTGGYPDSISIGKGTQNFASGSLNIGNLIYATGIYSGSTPSSTPINGFVGINTSTPSVALQVGGGISSSGLMVPITSSLIPTYTGSMYYSASKLWIYTGTGNAGGHVGWQTASLDG